MSRRLIELEGCLNFRDLGGYPTRDGRLVRWGHLFRSDAIHLLTVADVEEIRRIGIGTIVDLRSSPELNSDGRGPLGQEAMMAFHHIPLFDGEQRRSSASMPQDSLADIYFMLAEFARGPIARVIRVLADSEAPAVYHCAAGKDRTGVISAILLGLLDVADELIIADYALTSANIDAIIDRLLGSEGYRNMLANLPPDTMHAHPETMEGFLARIAARYGSMTGYALDIGVGEDHLSRLRQSMVV